MSAHRLDGNAESSSKCYEQCFIPVPLSCFCLTTSKRKIKYLLAWGEGVGIQLLEVNPESGKDMPSTRGLADETNDRFKTCTKVTKNRRAFPICVCAFWLLLKSVFQLENQIKYRETGQRLYSNPFLLSLFIT